MPLTMVQTTVKYRKAGVRPPVFVAGSFSDPEWIPREMDWVLDERGEKLFTKEVEVEEDREYQYKFKLGHGNDWDLDEESPTTLDNIGNTNNLLNVTSNHRPGAIRRYSGARDAHYSPHITPSGSAKPVLSVIAQVTEARKHYKNPEPSTSPGALRGAESIRHPDDFVVPSTPLFAHECLGAYDFEAVDDGFDHSLSPSASRGMSVVSFGAFAPDHLPQSIDDPMLEKFPSDKSAVINTLRRISISMGEGPAKLEDRPLSPKQASRRDSVDSTTDSVSSPGSLSPTSSRKRDSRLSHSSLGRTKSAVSLGSIVEEPPREAGSAFPGHKASQEDYDAVGFTSDEDGPQMVQNKVSTAHNAKENCDSQASSVALSPKTLETTILEASKSRNKLSSEAGESQPIESRRFITGAILLLAMVVTWWKSCRNWLGKGLEVVSESSSQVVGVWVPHARMFDGGATKARIQDGRAVYGGEFDLGLV